MQLPKMEILFCLNLNDCRRRQKGKAIKVYAHVKQYKSRYTIFEREKKPKAACGTFNLYTHRQKITNNNLIQLIK